MFNKLACSKRKPNILSLNISPNNIFSYIETSPSDVVHPEGLFLITVSIDMIITIYIICFLFQKQILDFKKNKKNSRKKLDK